MAFDEQQRTERVNVFLSKAEMGAVKEFRFDEQLSTTADALRELMRRGLLSAPAPHKLH